MDVSLTPSLDTLFPESPPDDRAAQTLAVQVRDDPQAFGALYDHYFARVYNYVRYRVQDAHTADDVTAQIFERVLHYLPSYQPKQGAFGAWLFAIARSVVSNHHRANRRWRWLPWEVLRAQPADHPTPEHAVEQQDQYERVLQAVATLDERERDLIALRFGSGLSHREIARMTNLTDGHVGVILHRALRKLRQILQTETPSMEDRPNEA
jgi:RNA polymerase sigma-70 factor (ECF subfamily)